MSINQKVTKKHNLLNQNLKALENIQLLYFHLHKNMLKEKSEQENSIHPHYESRKIYFCFIFLVFDYSSHVPSQYNQIVVAVV